MLNNLSKIKQLIKIVFLLISLPFQSQNMNAGMLSGFVISDQKEKLPGATIFINKTSFGTQTELDGNYTIHNIPFGTYTLTASFVGYTSVTKTIKINTENVQLDMVLSESTEVLNEVNLKGTTTKEQIETKGFAANSIEVQKIKTQAIQATEILDQTSGVRLRQSGGMGSQINYNINGLSGNSVRIFIDGIPIQNYGPSFSLSSIPTSMIKRIEVYKGVVPAELSSDALGGAINVVLNEMAATTLDASFSFGSFNTYQTNINGGYRNEKSGFTAKGSVFYNYTDNDYSVWGNEIYITNIKTGDIEYITAKRFHDTYQSKGVKLDVGYTNVKWADQFYLGTIISGMKKDIQHGATMESVYGTRNGKQSTVMLNTTYNKTNFVIENLDLNIFASYSDLKRKTIDTIPFKYNWNGELTEDYWNTTDGKWLEHITGAEGNRPTLNTNYEKTFATRSNLIYQINHHHKVGVNYILTNFRRNSYDPLLDEKIRELLDTRHLSKSILGITYELNAIDNRFKSSIFFKYYKQNVIIEKPENISSQSEPIITRFNKKIDISGFGIALSYIITPTLQLMTSAENAIRLPDTQELFGNDIENTDENYNLNPETSTNINFGVNLGPYQIRNHRVKLNTNFFYRNTTNKIKLDIKNDQTAEVSNFVNENSFLSTGFDTELNYTYKNNLNFLFGTSVFNSRFNTEFNTDGEPYQWYGDRERNAPYFTFNANIKYNFNQFIQKNAKTSIYYNLGYVHEFFRDWESLGGAGKDIIPSQLVSNFGVGYTFPDNRIILSLDAKNIFNQQVFDNYALQKPGRAFYIKLNYKII